MSISTIEAAAIGTCLWTALEDNKDISRKEDAGLLAGLLKVTRGARNNDRSTDQM